MSRMSELIVHFSGKDCTRHNECLPSKSDAQQARWPTTMSYRNFSFSILYILLWLWKRVYLSNFLSKGKFFERVVSSFFIFYSPFCVCVCVCRSHVLFMMQWGKKSLQWEFCLILNSLYSSMYCKYFKWPSFHLSKHKWINRLNENSTFSVALREYRLRMYYKLKLLSLISRINVYVFD